VLDYLKRSMQIDSIRHKALRRFAEWALTVTKNWRMTFRINAAGAIEDMDLEDYH